MINMVETVLNALKADTDLDSMVNGRIFWIRPANTPQLPYITFFEVSNSQESAADDDEYSDNIEIQLDIWSQSSFIQVAKEVQRIMKGLGFSHIALPDQFEKDTQIFHKAIQFNITKEV